MAGLYYDDLKVGQQIAHSTGRTVTEADTVLFSALTMNPQPLHLNEDFASRTEFGTRIANGLFTLGLLVGLTVPELTLGTIVANLSYEQISHPKPVFHGDTLYARTQVINLRDSRSRPDCGVVTLQHTGLNQHGDVVIEVTRTALFLKRPPSDSPGA